jgi:hypothetical protein
MARLWLGIVFFAVIANTGCKNRDGESDLSEKKSSVQKAPAPRLCAAIRGNGDYILSHFGALAAITEKYGMLTSMAGGSSASITMFMYESMLMNPAVKSAPPAEKSARMAMLLKSVMGYYETVKESEEVQAITLLSSVVRESTEKGFIDITKPATMQAANGLGKLLSNPQILSLVNPQVLATLRNDKKLNDAEWMSQVKQVQIALSMMGSFSAKDQTVFFRDGVLSFEGLAHAMGRIADFYAGRSTVKLDEFISECTRPNVGMPWQDVSESCRTEFEVLVRDYRKSITQQVAGAQPRVLEPISKEVNTIISTSVLVSPLVTKAYSTAKSEFDAGTFKRFPIEFRDVRFGYWMSEKLAISVTNGIDSKRPKDGKDEKFKNLGANASWMDVLKASPAEPGISAGVTLKDGSISLGGWSDLAPVQVLRHSDTCDKIIYITRRGEESKFIAPATAIKTGKEEGITVQLSMKEDGRKRLYDTSTKASGFGAAIASADAVWCTDWNGFKSSDGEGIYPAMYREAYTAELYSKDAFFTDRYDRVTTAKIVGCSN